MIKKYYDITIGDLDIMELTGNISHFKTKFKFLPVSLFVRKIDKELKKAYEFIENNKLNQPIEDSTHKTKVFTDIRVLEACYEIIHLHLKEGVDHEITQGYFNFKRRERRKLKFTPSRLKTAIQTAFEYSNIKVETIQDANKLAKYIERKRDKFDEMYKQKEKPKSEKKYYLLDVATSYQMYLNEDSKGLSEMTLRQFSITKAKADERIANERKPKTA